MAGPRTKRLQVIGAKVEDTKGTPETLTASEAAILATVAEINQGIQWEDRPMIGILGGELANVPNESIGRARITVEVRGKGSSGVPVWAELLRGCALAYDSDTQTYTPVTSIDDQETLTIGGWIDGLYKEIAGAVGTVTFRGSFGKRMLAEFEFIGIWNAPDDDDAPGSITHETTSPLRLASTTFNVGGSSPKFSTYACALNNGLQLRPDATAASAIAHGYVDRGTPTVDFDPEQLLVADSDIYGTYIAGTTVAHAITVGTADHNKMQISVPRLQYMNLQEQVTDGLMRTGTSGNKAIAADGDDELSIVFPVPA